MLSDHGPYDVGATLRWVEIAERLRSTEVTLLHGLALVRGVDPDLSAMPAMVLSSGHVAELLAVVNDLGSSKPKPPCRPASQMSSAPSFSHAAFP